MYLVLVIHFVIICNSSMYSTKMLTEVNVNAPSGRCRLFPSDKHHILCNRPLCDICKLFREYYFLCFKLLFEEEPLKFEKHLKEIAKFNKYKFNIYLKQVINIVFIMKNFKIMNKVNNFQNSLCYFTKVMLV